MTAVYIICGILVAVGLIINVNKILKERKKENELEQKRQEAEEYLIDKILKEKETETDQEKSSLE